VRSGAHVFIDEEEFVGACKLLKVEEEMAVGERENLRKLSAREK
jgi:hypothetical protein